MNDVNLFDITNTIILILLFWYQKNKNKLLNDRISEQSKLLSETKNIILTQASAIESQKKVVDTAIKYSETFNYDKVETIVKKELELEYQNIIKQHENTIEEFKEKNPILMQKETAEHAIKITAESYITPLLAELIIQLLEKEPKDRIIILDRLPKHLNDIAKHYLLIYEQEINKNANKTLERNKWKVRFFELLGID